MNEQALPVSLVERARAGDRDAFGELARQFDSVVFAIVLRRLRNRSEAREVTQEVFLRAMRKLPQLREPERFAGWIKQIAVNMAINRATRRPNESACAPDTFSGLTASSREPLDHLLRAEQAGAVRASIARLGEMDRQTLMAFYFEGCSLKQMADAFGSPVGTIKRRLHTARNRLRDEMLSAVPA